MARDTKNDFLIEEMVKDGLYQIRQDGKVLTYKLGNGRIGDKLRFVKLTSSNGYLGLRYKGKFILIHRILYRKFIGDLKPGMVVNHKDGVKNNNSIENLELVSDSENSLHAYREKLKIPTKLFGRANPSAKFSTEEAEEIRRIHAEEGLNYSQIARLYNTSRVTIRSIVTLKTYPRSENASVQVLR